MSLRIAKAEVWVATIEDKPGGLAGLLESLAASGANLDCVIARRMPDKPGSGVAFLTPIRGKKVMAAASAAGLSRARTIATLRVEGPDRPGAGARIARTIADLGISVRGVSALTMGNRFVAYIGFDTAADASKAAKALRTLNRPVRRK